MKKVIFAVLFLAFYAYASGSLWMHDYTKALKKAKEVHKPLLLMYSAKT